MRIRSFNLPGLALAVALGLAAAASGPAPASAFGCQTAPALTLIGKAAPSDREVKALTGARIVRRVAPGDMATLRYVPTRVSLGVQDGLVVTVSCG